MHHEVLHDNDRKKSKKPKQKATISAEVGDDSDAKINYVQKQDVTNNQKVGITVMPTMLVKVTGNNGQFKLRCLLDSGASHTLITRWNN